MHEATLPPSGEHLHMASKFYPSHADLQIGNCLDKDMGNLRVLSGVEVNLFIEIRVKVLRGIENTITLIALEKSRPPKVGNPQVY